MIAPCWTKRERTGSVPPFPPCLLLVQAMDGVHLEPAPPAGFGDTRSRPMR